MLTEYWDRRRALANLDRLDAAYYKKAKNKTNRVIGDCLSPIPFTGLSSLMGGAITGSLGQGFNYGATLGAGYGCVIPSSVVLGYYGAKACRHYEDIKREARDIGMASMVHQQNPLQQAASGASMVQQQTSLQEAASGASKD